MNNNFWFLMGSSNSWALRTIILNWITRSRCSILSIPKALSPKFYSAFNFCRIIRWISVWLWHRNHCRCSALLERHMARNYGHREVTCSIISFTWGILWFITCWTTFGWIRKKNCYYFFGFIVCCWFIYYGFFYYHYYAYDWTICSRIRSRYSFHDSTCLFIWSLTYLNKGSCCCMLYCRCYYWLVNIKWNRSCLWQKLEINARSCSNTCLYIIIFNVFYAGIIEMACKKW